MPKPAMMQNATAAQKTVWRVEGGFVQPTPDMVTAPTRRHFLLEQFLVTKNPLRYDGPCHSVPSPACGGGTGRGHAMIEPFPLPTLPRKRGRVHTEFAARADS